MHELSDGELMARTREGDHDAFALLVDRHKDSLVNYLSHLVRDRGHAEELAQEAFVKLYEHAAQYREEGRLAPYLFKIATNLFRSELRRKQRWGVLVHMFTPTEEAHKETPQKDLLEQEIVDRVSRELARLPILYRSAVILRDIEGLSYEEIAEALETNIGTIKSRIGRGREQLRVALTPYWNGGEHARREAR
jgi:RNA polymerase sigma-70 factor (ECF subfamily)